MRYFLASSISIVMTLSGVARAQMGPGMGGMPGGSPGGAQQPAGDEKKEGVAVEAPKSPELLPTTPALPPPKSRRKRWKLLEMDGYFRLRGDYFKNFNLGFLDEPAIGGAPFPRDVACNSQTLNHPCDDSVRGANMRLRLEPIINIDEGISVHMQADVFDNLVLGSTPSALDLAAPGYSSTNLPPVTAFSNTQGSVVRGVNSAVDSIQFKRAWAEIAVPLGIIKVGRMPNQWGMGIWANAGGYDPVTGMTNYDADYGDSVDRVSFTAQIPGTQLRAMVAADWDATGLTSNMVSATGNANALGANGGQYAGYTGAPFDLDDSDDSNGWVGVISKMESPQDFREAVDRGDSVLDYGVYFEYKTQDWAEDFTGFTLGGAYDPTTKYVPRNLKTYTPDLWGHWGYGPWDVEGEFVGQFGSVQNLDDLGITGGEDIRKMGGAVRGSWRGVENKLKLGVEVGFATGDQWDNVVQGQTNIAYENQVGLPSICNTDHTCTLTQFNFNRDYQVDLIMWRYLFGAVTNAVYYKPSVQYDFTKNITAKLWNVTSMAMKPVSTPGNSLMYGTEFDIDLSYHDGRIFAGLAYGILLPFGAMAHPDDANYTGPGFGYGTDQLNQTNVGDPGTAQTIQARLALQF
jgi:uncharacterized protein (TIGR04551 family)